MKKLYVIEDNPYFGPRKYVIARATKTQLITGPINDAGAVIRFRRPDTITDGARIFKDGSLGGRFSVVTYTLKLGKED